MKVVIKRLSKFINICNLIKSDIFSLENIKPNKKSLINLIRKVKLSEFLIKPKFKLYYPNQSLRLSWQLNRIFIDLSFLTNGNISLLIDNFDDPTASKDLSDFNILHYTEFVNIVNKSIRSVIY